MFGMQQLDKCDICNTPDSGKCDTLGWFHYHVCHDCNSYVSSKLAFNDNYIRMRAAINQIERYQNGGDIQIDLIYTYKLVADYTHSTIKFVKSLFNTRMPTGKTDSKTH